MKKITEYQCEICHKRYDTAEEAKTCEAKGVFDPSKFPIGTMYEHHHHGFVGIFAVGEASNDYPHYGNILSYAARVAPYPPGVPTSDVLCGGSNSSYSDDASVKRWVSYHFISKEKVNSFEFKRMVSFLKSKNIQPQYYDSGGNLIKVK